MKNKKGFTLIELLVAIALMLSVLGIAIVSFISISNRKKEEAYEAVKKEIIGAAEQYIDSNEYLFEGLSDGSSGIITVGELVNQDYLNKVTDPRNGKTINKCSQVRVTKKNGIYSSEFYEYVKGDKCDSNYSITIKEPGAPDIDLNFYKQGNVNKSISIGSEDDWFNISKLGENGKLGIKVVGKTEGNGKIIGISMCSYDGKEPCTNYGDYVTTNSIYNDNNTFNTDTKGKKACYKVTNVLGKSATKCVYAKVDTEKPSCTITLGGKTNGGKKVGDVQWYIGNDAKVTFNITKSDALSGINNNYNYSITEQTSETSSTTKKLTVYDNAGNLEKCISPKYGIEKSVTMKFNTKESNNAKATQEEYKNKKVFDSSYGACGYGACEKIYCYTDKDTMKTKCGSADNEYFARSCKNVKGHIRTFDVFGKSVNDEGKGNVFWNNVDNETYEKKYSLTKANEFVRQYTKESGCGNNNQKYHYKTCGISGGSTLTSWDYYYTSPAGNKSNTIRLITEYTIDCGYETYQK